MPDDFVTIQEAAEHLGKSTQTIRRMIKRGDLSAKQIRTPQGFHYVLAREQIGMSEIKESVTEKKEQTEMLHKTPVENHIIAQETEHNTTSTNQMDVLTNQHSEKPHTIGERPLIDKNELVELLERHHKETIFLYGLIDRLQRELDREKRRPKSFFAYFFDWLSH